MNKYGKNFILCGEIEHYCLLCQEIFHSMPDVEKHIRWEKHRKNLKDQAYLPRFKKDFIYKIENKFYCELCNLVVSDFAAIKEHINNGEHKDQKINPRTETKNFVGKYDSGSVVFNKVVLSKVMWNSIVDQKCLLCNVEAKNVDQHLAAEEHILKLIQSKIECQDKKSYFRKINDDMFHCFTCKKVFTGVDFHSHWPNCKNVDEIKKGHSGLNTNANTIFDILGSVDAMKEIQQELIGPLQSFFQIDTRKNIATCKTCRLKVANEFSSLLQHIENHVPKDNPEKEDSDTEKPEESVKETEYVGIIDHGKRRLELAKYGKLNNIKLNYNGSKGWCLLCDRYISAHMNNFKQHVKGDIHRGNLELKGLISPKTLAIRCFKTKNIFKCSLHYLPEKKEFYINDEYSVNVLSFLLLRQIDNDPHFKKTKCYACTEVFPQGQERQHCETETHRKKFLAAKVLQNDEGEFIREIRPNFFHCGFCNMTFPYKDTMDKHTTTLNHQMIMAKNMQDTYRAVKINTKHEDVYEIILQVLDLCTSEA